MGIRLVVHNFTGIKNSSSSHDHDKLIHRDMEDQHPISAITGLQDVINELRDHNVTKFEDTDSIDFRINSRTNTLEADVRVDPSPKNTITITNNGLFIDGNTVQVEELPEPCAEEEGNVYQYIGDTTEYWLKDIFYECKENLDKKVYGYRYGSGIEFYVPSNAITDGAYIYSSPNCVSPFGQIQGVGENDTIAIRVYGSGGDWNSGAVGNGNVWRDTSLDVSHYYWDIATTNYQLTEFPMLQPNSDYVGKAFQYTGESNDNFHKSEFYRCELDESKQLYVYPVSLSYGNTRYLYSSLPVGSIAGSYLYDAIDEQGNLTGDAHYVSYWYAGRRDIYGTVDGIGYIQCFTSFRLPIYKWVSLNLSADRLNLEDLKNVSINAVANNQIIRYKDGFWINDTEAPIPELSNDNPLMDGTATPGTSEKTSRSDHIHPHDTTKQDVIQYSSLPDPNASYEGKIYQYTGATGQYTQGQFYRCNAHDTFYFSRLKYYFSYYRYVYTDKHIYLGDSGNLYFDENCTRYAGTYYYRNDYQINLYIPSVYNGELHGSGYNSDVLYRGSHKRYLWEPTPVSIIQDDTSSTTTTYSSSKIDTLIDNTNTSLTTEINNLKDGKQDTIQFLEMPEPTADLLGKVYQYIGDSTEDFKTGVFYKCVPTKIVTRYRFNSYNVPLYDPCYVEADYSKNKGVTYNIYKEWSLINKVGAIVWRNGYSAADVTFDGSSWNYNAGTPIEDTHMEYVWVYVPDCLHKHDNKEQLDKITEKDGDPYYDNRMFLMEDTYSDEDIEQAILDVLDELSGKLNNNVFFTSDMEVFTTSDDLIFRVQDDDTGE